LTGKIPTNVFHLPYLVMLDSSYNRFTRLPHSALCSALPSAWAYLAGNGFACCLNCQADGEWTSLYSTPHCPDQQGVAFSDLNEQLAVSKALAKVIPSIVHYIMPITGSDRKSNRFYIFIHYPNDFQFLVACTQYYGEVLCPQCEHEP